MIELTRLNGNPLYVNCDLIKWAEAAPDTLLTLINGEKIVVRESCSELVERVRKHRLLLLAELIRIDARAGEPSCAPLPRPASPDPGAAPTRRTGHEAAAMPMLRNSEERRRHG